MREKFYCDDEDCWESFRDSVPSSCPVCGGTKFITELEHKQREYLERNADATIDVKETFYCADESCWESFDDSVPSSCPVCGGTKFITELEDKQRKYRERNADATKERHEELALTCIGCLTVIFMLFALLWALGYAEPPELPNSWKINPYKDWKAD